MNARSTIAWLIVIGGLGLNCAAAAPQSEATILNQPTLTGNWWGVRDNLAEHGLTFDLSLTQFFQGVTSGGVDKAFQYGGKVDSYIKFDAGKANWWPGFNVIAHVETRYGEDVNNTDGMLTFGNFNMNFPRSAQTVTGVTALKVTQTLGNHFMLIAGKINTLDDFRLNFTGFNGRDRFMNSAVVANVINARTIPYSTYGAGFAIFENKGPEFTFLVRDPDDHATTVDLDELFAHGVLLTASLRLPITPMGLPGTQVFGANWSSRDYTSRDPSAWVSIPGQEITTPTESGSWALWYNFDQHLWIDPADKDRWLGIFGMAGASDANPNAVAWNATVGMGGGGLVPGRKYDTFGVAYFQIGLSDDFKDLLSSSLAPPGLAQRNEQGVEMYYNAAITPWCHLTFDLQIVEPSTRDVDTTVLLGTRLKIDL